MQNRQQFGNYALFKRLATDSLGETWRAGRLGSDGVEQVVLLRLWKGAGLDGQRFWDRCADRKPLQQLLKSPHLGEGVDMGFAAGVPFFAYEYISGKGLHELLRETRERPFPIPPEHALFIAERLAIGLAAALDKRFADARIVHGLVVPPLVWLSNEGEVRVLGLEAGPAFATLSPETRAAADLSPYLSPEVAAGEPATSADDVYSLGALLYEMLTGKGMPVMVDDPAQLVREARLATEGEPLALPLAEVLARSLAPRGERIETVDRWGQGLSKLILEGDYNPTTFNLAFFMHTLFRGDIHRESEEIESETTSEFELTPLVGAAAPEGAAADTSDAASPSQAATGSAGTAPARDSGPLATLAADPEPSRPGEPEETPPPKRPARAPSVAGVGKAAPEKGGRRKVALIAAVAALLLAGGAGAYYWFVLRPGSGGAAAGAAATAIAPGEPIADLAPDSTAPAAPPGGLDSNADAIAGEGDEASIPAAQGGGSATVAATDYPEPPATPEEIQSTIRQLVAERTGRMEESLKAEYDTKLEELREQLDQAREASAKAQAADVTPPAGARPGTSPGRTGAPAAGTTQPAAAPAKPPQSPAGTGTAGAGEPAAGNPPQEEAAEPLRAPLPPPVEVKRGDLVGPGPGVTPAKMLRQPQAVYPLAARKFSREATVKVRVLVDENGRVVEADQVSEPAGYGFDDAAVKAARATRWSPGTKDGVKVKMWVDLTIVFKP